MTTLARVHLIGTLETPLMLAEYAAKSAPIEVEIATERDPRDGEAGGSGIDIHRVLVPGSVADRLLRSTPLGSVLFVEGRLVYRKSDKARKDRLVPEIIAERVVVITEDQGYGALLSK
jgi:Single-strand binding protein family